MRRSTVVFVAAIAVLGIAGGARAESKCAGSKLKAVAKKAKCRLGLEAKETGKAEAKDAAKDAACGTKFSEAFAKADGKDDCLTLNDEVPIEQKVDDFVDDVDDTLNGGSGDPPTTPSKCTAGQLKTAAKKAKCLLGLEAKEAAKGELDTVKLQACTDKFGEGFAKAQGKGDCLTPAVTEAAIEQKIDDFVADVDGMLNPSSGVTTTTTISGPTTTTTTIPVCGNSNVEGSETCDDGNTSNNDSCPSDCIVDACTPVGGSNRQASLSFSPPVGVGVAGLTVLLDYPEGKVSIPGSGGSIPAGIIADFPSGASGASNDFDHALRQVVSRTTNMPAGLLFRVHFEDCQTAPAPTAGEFTCTVLDAADQNGIDVSGVTCSVTLP